MLSDPWVGEPILATAVVPWTDRLEFDEPAFCAEVRAIASGLTKHIYIFGTAGEGYAVTDAQFDRIAASFLTCAQGCGARPMLGVISLSLGTVIERIERGRAMGFREFQISLPSWGALNDRELDRFFAETCGRFSDCSFLHYNLARSRRLLGGSEYRRLAAAHPNLVAVKASLSDPAQVRDLVESVPRITFYLTEFGYVEARRIGPCGLLISLASVHPGRAREFVRGDDALRTACVDDFRVMVAALQQAAKGSFHIDGGFDKMLFRVNHPEFPLRMLPPYQGPSEEQFQQFKAALPDRWKT